MQILLKLFEILYWTLILQRTPRTYVYQYTVFTGQFIFFKL